MWFLALELWPYLLAALGIGLVTGWLSGCGPSRRAADASGENGEATS